MSYLPGITFTSAYEKLKATANALREGRTLTNSYELYPLDELKALQTKAITWIKENQEHNNLYEAKQRLIKIEDAIKKKQHLQDVKNVTDILFT